MLTATKEMTFTSEGADQLEVIAANILKNTGTHRILTFYGDMGAGKTTLIKALCRKMGVTDNVTSPTFAIMNEYELNGEPVYHFDFYRINAETEAYDLGYENFFYSGNYCFVEWPEKIKNLLTFSHAQIHISELNGTRTIKLMV